MIIKIPVVPYVPLCKRTQSAKPLTVKSDTDEATRTHSSKPKIETTPSIKSYQTLLEQEGIIGNQIRLTKDPTLYKERESVQIKIHAMAHCIVQDPELMAKAKEIDLHFNIERMAILHNTPRPSKELEALSKPMQSQESPKESPLIIEYLKLKKTFDEVGFTTQKGWDALESLEKVCHEIHKVPDLCAQVKLQSEKMFEDIHSRAESYAADLKPSLKKGIKHKI